MSQAKRPVELLKKVATARQQADSIVQASKALGMSDSTFRRALDEATEKGYYLPPENVQMSTPWREDRRRDYWILEANDSRISSAEDCVKKSGADMAIWEIASVEVKAWDTTMKIKAGDVDKPYRSQNQYIKVTLKRKVTPAIEEAWKMLIERAAKHSPKYKRPAFKVPRNPCLMEISLYDAHFGKLAWAKETSQDYDLKIAATVWRNAVHDLLNHATPYNIEKIVFPCGQDFFHINDSTNSTPKAKNLLDVDGRYAKIVDAGTWSFAQAIEECVKIAPVHVPWVWGNHDPQMSCWLAKWLKAYFRNNKHVTVDDSPKPRKAMRYGRGLIGWTHGDEEAHRDLPANFMSENRELMADLDWIELKGGHFHKKKEIVFTSVDTLPGNVVYRTLPSLSGRDAWHAHKGYGTMQAAEAAIYSQEQPTATFTVRARTNHVAKKGSN